MNLASKRAWENLTMNVMKISWTKAIIVKMSDGISTVVNALVNLKLLHLLSMFKEVWLVTLMQEYKILITDHNPRRWLDSV
jgi:hypothetical protein